MIEMSGPSWRDECYSHAAYFADESRAARCENETADLWTLLDAAERQIGQVGNPDPTLKLVSGPE